MTTRAGPARCSICRQGRSFATLIFKLKWHEAHSLAAALTVSHVWRWRAWRWKRCGMVRLRAASMTSGSLMVCYVLCRHALWLSPSLAHARDNLSAQLA